LVGVGVIVGVSVGVGKGIAVGAGVLVDVGITVDVCVGMGAGMAAGAGVLVGVGVTVDVCVGMGAGLATGVGVGEAVEDVDSSMIGKMPRCTVLVQLPAWSPVLRWNHQSPRGRQWMACSTEFCTFQVFDGVGKCVRFCAPFY